MSAERHQVIRLALAARRGNRWHVLADGIALCRFTPAAGWGHSLDPKAQEAIAVVESFVFGRAKTWGTQPCGICKRRSLNEDLL